MSLGTFVAGRFSGTYKIPSGAAVSIGLVEKGYTLSFSFAKDIITDTDAYARMIVDAIYQGVANCFLQSTFKEWLAQDLILLSPYQATAWPASGTGYFGPGTVGVLDSTVAGTTVLTATSGTAAATYPASLTATYTAIAENMDVSMLLGMDHRKLPFRLRIYPYLDTVIKYFTVT